ncbi:MAG TPA: hypothetical protein VNZ86_07470, partial [Bacteroidia bacterium]|nr:hypothetical protein [Bacteroidia bacterium]
EPYPVPTDYFEWLPARIQDKLKTHTRAQNRFIWLFQSLRLRYLIPAGVVCLVIALSLHFLLPAPTTAASLTLTDQDKKEVIENPEAFGLEESIVMEQVAAKGKFGEKAIPPEQTEAIDYLLDNNVDINTLPADN